MLLMHNEQTLKHSVKGLIMLMLSLVLLFSFSALGGEETSNILTDNPEDSKTYDSLPYNRQVLLKKLNRRIDKLQMSYISQLYKAERYEAQKLLDEIREIATNLAYTSQAEPQVIVITPSSPESSITINVNPSEPPAPKIRAMLDKDFADLKLSIRRNNFSDAGLNTLKSATEGNYFRSTQIMELLGLFTFSDDKIKALEIAYPKCLDSSSKYKILDAFMFDTDKKIAQEIMNRTR